MISTPEVSSESDEELKEILNNDASNDRKNERLLENNEVHSDKKYQINYTTSGFFSRISFYWSKLAMQLANKGILKTSDVCALSREQSTRYNIEPLRNAWNKYSKNQNSRYPLLLSILVVHSNTLLTLLFLDLALVALDYCRMFFFNDILVHFSTGIFFPEKKSYNHIHESIINYKFNLYESVAIFGLLKVTQSFIFHNLEFKNKMFSERITNEIDALLYEKILRGSTTISSISKGEGEKLNLVEVDSETIGQLFFMGPKLITAPIRLLISMLVLFKMFGKTFRYGLYILLGMLFFIFILQLCYLKNLKILLNCKDNRMNIVSYVFQILKSIKLNGWDDEFIRRIKVKRDDELNYVKKNLNIEIIKFVITSNLPLILMIICISKYSSQNEQFETSKLFTTFQLITSLSLPLMGIPLFLNQFFTNMVSIRRLQHFLDGPEHSKCQTIKDNESLQKGIILRFDRATFGIYTDLHLYKNYNRKGSSENEDLLNRNYKKLGKSKEKNKKDKIDYVQSAVNFSNNTTPDKIPLLNDISICLKKGEFIAVVGPTGSGKSCLLQSILNNYSLFSSKTSPILNGELSYAPQQPWIMTETIRNNIIFFEDFVDKKYKDVIKACHLEHDFANLKNSDLTLVNGTSANVSGGQKARISLARCLYKNAEIYLLDDPLSAIDSKVGNNIFKDAFCGYLKEKTRILVTSELNGISEVDRIIYMEKGKILFSGDYQTFTEHFGNNRPPEKLEKSPKQEENFSFDDNEDSIKSSDENKVTKENDEKIRRFYKSKSNKSLIKLVEKEELKHETSIVETNPLVLLDRENEKHGKVSIETYKTFIKLQGGYFILFILLLFIIASRFVDSYRRTYITSLTKSFKELNKIGANNKVSGFEKFPEYIKISLLGILLNFLVHFMITRATIGSLRTLHETMIEKLVHAPINLFHDLVPLGQILNRLTKDIDLVEGIIREVNFFTRNMFALISSLILCLIYSYVVIISMPIIIIGSILINKYYINAARNLTRLHRISYSPILTIISESISGVDIIRIDKVEEKWRDKIYKRLDDHFGVHLYIEGALRWFNLRLRILGHVLFGALLLYMSYFHNSFSAQAMGIVLQCTEDFIGQLITSLAYYSKIETTMIGLERCDAVTRIQTEKNPSPNEETIIKKEFNWPVRGQINFENFSARYRKDTPLILKGITKEIPAGQKIGIVGRTGSGKSSLVLSLARIIEPFEGRIKIDNIDISTLKLSYLRQKISIVPQEPFLIEGTLRENVDPFNKYSEMEILRVLDDFCVFKDFAEIGKLGIKINRSGENISSGERQLICFVRAVLKKSKIVILDEATSSLDKDTEAIIRKNMKKYFKDTTVISIAHHIPMVKNCEMILVIDDGRICEYGSYQSLMGNKNSTFYSLYYESIKK